MINDGPRTARAVEFLVVLVLLAATATVRGQEPDIPITRASGPIRIDGKLDEAGWRTAAELPLRWEIFPGDNVAAPVKTTCWLTYDAENLYVGCRAMDPSPSQIRAQLRKRDRIQPDDRINVIIDPSFSGRQAYGFGVNALGSQLDYLVTHGGRSSDSSWDAIWDSAGRIVSDGYVVELAIPFRALTFPNKPAQGTWGINIARLYPRDVRYDFESHKMLRGDSCSLCQLNRLVGLSGIRPGSSLLLSPSLTAKRTDSRPLLPHGAWVQGRASTSVGLTGEWSPRSDAQVATTINPDFSQVEIDLPQLEINRRFALFFPEKRPFFLAGSGYLDTPLDVINTRAIADPAWGLKATAQTGAWSGYAVTARDSITNLVIPGSEGSDDAALDGGNISLALRLRRDLGERSTLGAVITGRRGKDGYSSFLMGVDGDFRFGRSEELTWQLAGSSTRYPAWLAEEYGQPHGLFHGHALNAEYRHKGRDWVWSVALDDRSRGLRADLGFLPQVGLRQGSVEVERRWWGKTNTWYTYSAIGASGSYTQEAGGSLLNREVSAWGDIQAWAQSLVSLTVTRRTEVFGGVAYQQQRASLFFTFEPSRALAFSLFAERGDDIDYAHNSAGKSLSFGPRFNARFGRHMTSELRYWRQHFWREEGTLYLAQLTDLRLNYFLDRRVSVRAVLQYRETERNPRFWGSSNPSERGLFWRVLFVYRVNAVSELYAGISQTQIGNNAYGLTPADRTVFLKLRYAFLR